MSARESESHGLLRHADLPVWCKVIAINPCSAHADILRYTPHVATPLVVSPSIPSVLYVRSRGEGGRGKGKGDEERRNQQAAIPCKVSDKGKDACYIGTFEVVELPDFARIRGWFAVLAHSHFGCDSSSGLRGLVTTARSIHSQLVFSTVQNHTLCPDNIHANSDARTGHPRRGSCLAGDKLLSSP